jgi:DNA polymerase-3 subunit delta'
MVSPAQTSGAGMGQTIGHRRQVEQFVAGAASGNISRANLITGPERVGKAHLALRFAAALNCTTAGEPCGVCSNCRRIAARTHPDVMVISPDDGHVKIGQIRQMQYELALKPYEARWRVAIITDMHTATEEAQNALLKTLEEPPAQAVLILTALDAGLLVPTVVSRCRAMALQPVPAAVIAAALVERGLTDANAADEIARLSAGRVGWALEAAGNPRLVEQREQVIADLLDLVCQGSAARISAADTLGRQSNLVEVIGEWQSAWRDVLLISGGCPELITNRQHRDRLALLAQSAGLAGAQHAAASTLLAISQLDQNVNPRLAVAAMLLGWCRLDSKAPESP